MARAFTATRPASWAPRRAPSRPHWPARWPAPGIARSPRRRTPRHAFEVAFPAPSWWAARRRWPPCWSWLRSRPKPTAPCCSRARPVRASRCWRGRSRAGARVATRPSWSSTAQRCPAKLIESELFGATRGAHSTASSARAGLVAAAEGGTLFLDEIAELPSAAQAKLLHLTQTGSYRRLGDDAPQRANIRIMAATNVDVSGTADPQKLRRDLYYRLAVVEIEMPTLDARSEDVPLLAQALVTDIAHTLGIRAPELTLGASAFLERRRWPGNVRELRNAIELAMLRARADDSRVLREEHFAAGGQPGSAPESLQDRTRAFQRRAIEDALSEAGGRATAAASALGMSRSHLYHLIASLGIERAAE
ncbi:MAG: sigma 54-interacting transcriptional regulator [Sandaracinaceae bacterium]|nr:sigma 54-interacting transcriptional regulator [Sandaracinaceae bacterium]